MIIDINEVYRYLGFIHNHKMEHDPDTDRIINEISSQVNSVCTPKSASRVFPCEIANNAVSFDVSPASTHTDYEVFESRALARHLTGCDRIILFAATLGPETDRLIRRLEITSLTRAAVAQAVGAAAIEAFADDECRRLESEYGKLKNRFSPGYGDLALENQLIFERLLNMRRSLGITLDDGLLMTPSKSITAVIGIPS